MPLPALLLVIAALLPLAACLLLLFIGRRMGTPLAGYTAIFFAALSFVGSSWALMRWVAGGNFRGLPYRQAIAPIVMIWSAFQGGASRGYPGFMDFGIYLDSLSVLLITTLTLGIMLLHIFAARSMRRDPQLPRFFTILALSSFAVLGLILSASLLHAIVFLELVSLCASMLVGFRLDREVMTRAGVRMFVINRVGDLGLILGVGILFAFLGKLTWPDLWLLAGDGTQAFSGILSDGSTLPTTALTLAGVALFFGAASRCAQFPLHVWTADASEGVAPAGGMVFALLQTVGGAFLMARLFPILTPSARLLIGIVGLTTLSMASLIALAQPGIKQVLAWLSTAQVGLIVVALGIGSWSGAMFHLVSFCYFQLLLFLAAGAVIRAARGETELEKLGGLVRKMPITAVVAAIGLLAACGAGSVGVGLSGYYSRGMIFKHAAAFATMATNAPRSKAYWAFFLLPVVATGLNAIAMTRWWMLIFGGRPRDRRLYNHAREAPTLLWPMAVLAIMTILAGGWLGVGEIIDSSIIEAREGARRLAQAWYPSRQPAAAALFSAALPIAETVPDDSPPDETSDLAPTSQPALQAALTRGAILADRGLVIALALGLSIGALLYLPNPPLAQRLRAVPPISWLHHWLRNRMYFDELYEALFVTLVVGLAGLMAWVDRNVVQALARVLMRV